MGSFGNFGIGSAFWSIFSPDARKIWRGPGLFLAWAGVGYPGEDREVGDGVQDRDGFCLSLKIGQSRI